MSLDITTVLARVLLFLVVAMLSDAAALATEVVQLTVVERQGVARRGEPVTFAVPFPKSALRAPTHVRLTRDGKEVPAQFRSTGLWRPGESTDPRCSMNTMCDRTKEAAST